MISANTSIYTKSVILCEII
uniref:Uncharacterized protein n=1 Tax=Arundo donax TaxID=35708 RepID=A0A0A9F5P6_ARUDO